MSPCPSVKWTTKALLHDLRTRKHDVQSKLHPFCMKDLETMVKLASNLETKELRDSANEAIECLAWIISTKSKTPTLRELRDEVRAEARAELTAHPSDETAKWIAEVLGVTRKKEENKKC